MKNQYNIKINPPKLSSEQIEQHRDFDALLQAFEQTQAAAPSPEPVSQPQKGRGKLRYLLYAMTAAAAVVLMLLAIRDSNPTVQPAPIPTQQMAELLQLKAPLPKLEQRFERRVIADASKGEVLHYPSGSEVAVPAAAFVDAEGYPVEGAVEIEYREFADAVDMFLAGIPQQLGKHQNLQSTGMMEIKGYQDGKPVYLNMDKKLDINLRGKMPVATNPDELGVYVYSVQNDAWEYQSQDRIERLGQPEQPTNTVDSIQLPPEALEEARRTLAASQPKAPIKPGISDDMQVFDFDININDYPELAAYAENVEFIGSRTALTPATFDTVWNAMDIVNKGNDTYELRLIYETGAEPIVRTIEVYPAVAATPAARAQYEAQQQQYEADVAAWEAEVVALASQSQPDAMPSTLVEVVNYFSIHRFGLWNCGKPIEWNESWPVEAAFVSEEGTPLTVEQVFVTTPAQQLYYSAPSQASNTVELKYAVAEDAPTIWAMSADGGLWVASAPTTPEERRPTIPLKGVAVPDSERDFRTLLTF